MRSRISTRRFAQALIVLGFAFALPAQAVQLDSSGENDEYVGVANYAFSYSSTPYELTGYCYNGDARDSQWWVIPSSCDPASDSSCWATTCEDCNNAEAYISMGSMRKGLLHYYAKDHKDDDQGICNFYIGSSSFSINFDYEDTGVDFSLSLEAGDGSWTTSGYCPSTAPAPGIGAVAQSFETNTDPSSQSNLICNEDFIVSLAADPLISNAAMISVINNPGSLTSGAQEFMPPARAMKAGDRAEGLVSLDAHRRFSNRGIDSSRWLVAANSEGDDVRGVLISREPSVRTEFAACQLTGDDGNPDLVDRKYNYECDFAALDGTSERHESLVLPGIFLRVRDRVGDLSPSPPTAADVVPQIAVAIRDFAPDARVVSADGLGTKVWHAESSGSRVMMVKRSALGKIDAVTHSPGGLSPSFMTCSPLGGGDELNPDYSCVANLRCTGSPCPLESWSVGSRLELPRALFKSRPCPPGQGVTAQESRLKLTRLNGVDGDGKLKFRSEMRFADGATVRPDETGFRLLVEDANGHTVVDLDIPGNGKSSARSGGGRRGKKRGRWKVEDGGKEFSYKARKSMGGIVPKVEIEREGRRGNAWEISVIGTRGQFDADMLVLPLSASLTLDPGDQNSNVCAVADFSGGDDKRGCRKNKKGSKITCR